MEMLRSLFEESRFHIDEGNLAVRLEQLRARIRLFPGMVLAEMLVELLFAWLMSNITPPENLLLWLLIIYSLHTWELLAWARYHNHLNSLAECRNWSRRFFRLALAVGLAWGIGILIFFPAALLPQLLVITVILGLSAGAVAMDATHLPSLNAYVLGMMLPLISRVVMEWDDVHWGLGLMMLLFLVVVLGAGYSLSRFIQNSLRQRFKMESLAAQLSTQKAIAETARKQTESMNKALRSNGHTLEQKVHERTAQLQRKTEEVANMRDVMVMAMGSLAETRDNETGNHIRRTQRYIKALATQLRHHPRFREFLTEENIDMLYKLAPLHDIGKIGIPDNILRKPGKLTPEEFETMKTHTLLGGNAIAVAESGLAVSNKFLHTAREIATSHHERWDGRGYPFRLKGDDIPIAARLMALADAYDALISRRVYKEPFTHEEAERILRESRGKQLDPDVVDAFLAIKDEFRKISEQYQG